MANTVRVKYVYLDVAAFTRGRSVEAQSEVVAQLNLIVKEALGRASFSQEQLILIPTGDGMAIAIIGESIFDAPLTLALEILSQLQDFNSKEAEPSRKFEVRIGINENEDNLIEDVNGRQNVAGRGISIAQRIMDVADAGQVLVGSTVHETLRQRERYMSSFRALELTIKHGERLRVYQYVDKSTRGLNVNMPTVFSSRKATPRLNRLVGHYIAHAARHREFLASRNDDPAREYAATVLLFFLAKDSVEEDETPSHERPTVYSWKAGTASFEEQYKFYYDLEFWVQAELAELVQKVHLASHRELFQSGSFCFLRPRAMEQLALDQPDLAESLGSGAPSSDSDVIDGT